jgi:hypothetical protein
LLIIFYLINQKSQANSLVIRGVKKSRSRRVFIDRLSDLATTSLFVNPPMLCQRQYLPEDWEAYPLESPEPF